MKNYVLTIPFNVRNHVHNMFINGNSMETIAHEIGYTQHTIWLILNTFNDTSDSLDKKLPTILSMLNDPNKTMAFIADYMLVELSVVEKINNGTHPLCSQYKDVIYPIQVSPHLTNEVLAHIYFDIIKCDLSLKQIAHKYAMGYKTIRHISAGTSWYNENFEYPLASNREKNLQKIRDLGYETLYRTDCVNAKIPTIKESSEESKKKHDESSKLLMKGLEDGSIKPLSNAKGYYLCSNGDLISCNYGGKDSDFGQIHNAYLKKPEYEHDSVRIIRVNGKRLRCDVAVAIEFVPNPNRYKYVTHLNGDGKDCRASNLAWSPIRDKNGKRLPKAAKSINPYDDVVEAHIPKQPINPIDISSIADDNDKLLQYIEHGQSDGTVKHIVTVGKVEYYVDRNGIVYSRRELTGDVINVVIMTPLIDATGAPTVNVPSADKSVNRQHVYRIVAKAFIEGYDDEHSIVHHKNHCRFDNRVDNLIWVTASENQGEKILFRRSLEADAIDNGIIRNGVDMNDINIVNKLRAEIAKKAIRRLSTEETYPVINIDNYLSTQKPFYGCIYLVTQEIDGVKKPMYIGQTRSNPTLRLKQHLYRADEQISGTASRKETISIFHYALMSYPLDNFTLSVVECNVPEDKLAEREVYWIDQLGTSIYKGGYNEYHDDASMYTNNSFKRINQAQLNQITQMLLDGHISFAEIARRTGTSQPCVTQINQGDIFYDSKFKDVYPLYYRSAIFKHQTYGDKKFVEIVTDLQQNVLSASDIALKHGISAPTVYSINPGKECYDELYEKYSVDVPIRIGRFFTIGQYCQLLIDYAKSEKQFSEVFKEIFGRHVRVLQGLTQGTTVRYDRLQYPLNQHEYENKQAIRDDLYVISKKHLLFPSRKEENSRMYHIGKPDFFNGDCGAVTTRSK